ncbi:tail sheath stabilizer [Vibrio phage K567]
MGNLFSGIYVARGDAYRKVPITVSSKEHFVAALNSQELNGDGNMALVATKLPRIGLDMVSCTYDSTRKTNVTNRKLTRDLSADRPAMNKLFNPVPYDFEFEVSVYTRHQDDAFQIIEQILPYFQPQFNTMIRELNESEVLIDERDIPIILESAVPETTFEGSAGEMRHIEWTLNMRLKGWLYPPTNAQFGEIRTIYLDFNEEEQEIIHAEREAVLSTSQIAFAIREAIGADVATGWRFNVDALSEMSWNMRSAVEHDVELPFNSLPTATSETEMLFNIRNAIDAQSEITYAFNEAITVELDVDYSTYSAIELHADVDWNYKSIVNKQSDIDYSSQTQVAAELDVDYNSMITTESATQIRYNKLSTVDLFVSTQWSQMTTISVDVGLPYHISGAWVDNYCSIPFTYEIEE